MRLHIFIYIGIIVSLCVFKYYDDKKGCCYTDKIGKFLNNNPFIKTLLFVITVILASIFCSAFVVEVSNGSDIDLTSFYTKDSFYYLIYVILFDFCYNWLVHTYDDVLRYNDESYCKAYVIKACLETQIERYKKQIESREKELKINNLFN